jgi:hypothetical protein
VIVEPLLGFEARQRFNDHEVSAPRARRQRQLPGAAPVVRAGLPQSPLRERITGTVVNSSGGPVNTRTIAILALIIAVIVILILVL